MNENEKSLNHCLEQLKSELGFNQIEVTSLKAPLTIAFYENWLQQNYYGSMSYLQEHLEIKKDPRKLNENLKSVISLAQSYFPLPEPLPEKNPARVALYAQNSDYHHWLKEKLSLCIDRLQKIFPDEIFLPYVDSGPVLERDWAYQNRLGWFGKNTCLIHPTHGSFFFIAEILSSLKTPDLDTFEALPDFCGHCQKCIEVCPTQALKSPRTLQADRCISYLTIEAKTVAAIELRPLIKDWFFGCDLCQSVCPWNEKVFRQKKINPALPEISTAEFLNLDATAHNELIDYFRWLLTASNKQIQKHAQGTALARAGAKGLKRNALIVIGNRSLTELKTEVSQLQIPELDELKNWTLSLL